MVVRKIIENLKLDVVLNVKDNQQSTSRIYSKQWAISNRCMMNFRSTKCSCTENLLKTIAIAIYISLRLCRSHLFVPARLIFVQMVQWIIEIAEVVVRIIFTGEISGLLNNLWKWIYVFLPRFFQIPIILNEVSINITRWCISRTMQRFS